MKTFIYILIALGLGFLFYNLTFINWEKPLKDDSAVAAICTMAAACVVVLLTILLLSKRIAEKAKWK